MKLLKNPILLFLIAYFVACFAWVHSGWYVLLFFLFLAPIYLIWGIVLCAVTRHREKKFPSYMADRKIRPTFAVLLALLFGQVIAIPRLSDNPDSIGVWSIFSGTTSALETSSTYNNAEMFMVLTNLGIIVALIFFTILVITDRKKISKDK